MRVGVFGGTFDPVHLGHLILAEQCREQGRLDEVWFIPAARPPHKLNHEITTFAQRVEMLALAIAGNPAFKISEVEKDRPGPSFTVHTLTELKQQYPQVEFFLLVGSDSLRDVPKWYASARIAELTSFLVMPRPGHGQVDIETVRAALPAGTPMRVEVVDSPLIDIASTDLRHRAAQGRSLRYLVPRAVEMYILERKLYQDRDK